MVKSASYDEDLWFDPFFSYGGDRLKPDAKCSPNSEKGPSRGERKYLMSITIDFWLMITIALCCVILGIILGRMLFRPNG
jgi:hypothetical protein